MSEASYGACRDSLCRGNVVVSYEADCECTGSEIRYHYSPLLVL